MKPKYIAKFDTGLQAHVVMNVETKAIQSVWESIEPAAKVARDLNAFYHRMEKNVQMRHKQLLSMKRENALGKVA